MSLSPRPRLDLIRGLTGLAGGVAVLCLALMAQRVAAVISFAEPLHVITSGWEQSALHTVWKALQGQEVYRDRHLFPYDATVYNYLFFFGYALPVRGLLDLLSLGEAWLPTVGRLLTLAGAAVGGGVGALVFRTVLGPERDRLGRLPALVALFVFLGPLMGWWAITVRPDAWALTLEVAAVGVFWSVRRRKGLLLAVLAAAAPLYIAWAVKQTAVTALGGLALFLLVRREGRALALLIIAFALPVGLTFAVGGADYGGIILMRGYTMTYSLGHAVDVLANTGSKTLPVLVGAAAVVLAIAVVPVWRRSVLEDDRLVLGGTGAVAGLGLAGVTSLQTGSAENYYFTAVWSLALVMVAGLVRLQDPAAAGGAGVLWPRRLVAGTIALAWVAQAGAVGLVLAGLKGATSAEMAATHRRMVAMKACIDPLPRPVYVHDDYLMLAWMAEGSTPFVKPFPYAQERAAGQWFERGGIGGLVGERWFGALVLPGAVAPVAEVDGKRPDGYEGRDGLCPGAVVMMRKEGA